QTAVLGDRRSGVRDQLFRGPRRLGHADHQEIELVAGSERLKRREDLLVGEIVAGAEEDQRVRAWAGHRCRRSCKPEALPAGLLSVSVERLVLDRASSL